MGNTEKTYQKRTFLSNFVLKIIALASMTLDHLGTALNMYFPSQEILINILRYLGRLALPLFCFLLVEGMIHTKSEKKYLSRLGIFALLISITLLVCYFIPELKGISKEGNIFLDLLLGGIMIYFLKKDKVYLKFISVVPLLLGVLSFICKCYENGVVEEIYWYPACLRLQYDWISQLLILCFFGSYQLVKLIWESKTNTKIDTILDTEVYRFEVNLISALFCVTVMVIHYLTKLFINPEMIFWKTNVQLIAAFSGALILFYNGRRGYNAKWFQYGCYLYYPLHILIVTGITYLIYILTI